MTYLSAMRRLADSELILNSDGSIYHLNLLPEDIADTIITVGDPNRVPQVSKHFDEIELKKTKREFVTHTGRIGNKRMTVISTGMGPGNIDIFMNELDALVNIDFASRSIRDQLRSLSIIRLGTSGSLHPDLHPGDLLVSQHAVGLDTVMSFYFDKRLPEFDVFLKQNIGRTIPHYWSSCNSDLNNKVNTDAMRGVTITAPGFYGAQNRRLRMPNPLSLPFDKMHKLRIKDFPCTNLEMETATIYAFSEILGHKALSINCILANRLHKTFTDEPKKAVSNMISNMLEELC